MLEISPRNCGKTERVLGEFENCVKNGTTAIVVVPESIMSDFLSIPNTTRLSQMGKTMNSFTGFVTSWGYLNNNRNVFRGFRFYSDDVFLFFDEFDYYKIERKLTEFIRSVIVNLRSSVGMEEFIVENCYFTTTPSKTRSIISEDDILINLLALHNFQYRDYGSIPILDIEEWKYSYKSLMNVNELLGIWAEDEMFVIERHLKEVPSSMRIKHMIREKKKRIVREEWSVSNYDLAL